MKKGKCDNCKTLLIADVSPPNISLVPDDESEEEFTQKTQAFL